KLVTGVQTCALPICPPRALLLHDGLRGPMGNRSAACTAGTEARSATDIARTFAIIRNSGGPCAPPMEANWGCRRPPAPPRGARVCQGNRANLWVGPRSADR